MRKEKKFNFNIHFKEDGETLEELIVDAILCYLKKDGKGIFI